MSERRHTDKPELNPTGVISLADNHAAMVGNRTLFPSTVVTVTADEPDRLLVSGKNNRKIGATVEKGAFKGYGIFMLSLEERATCPTDCSARAFCYGNGMQLARRHRIGDADVFFDRLGFEIAELLDEHPGLLIRLHVLGDFPSAEYVAFWKDVLDEYPNVACFGYTHRSPISWGGDEIGDAIQAVKDAHPQRFRIRWSGLVARADGAVIINEVPRGARAGDNSIVCPSQRDATACCATCALCWEAPHESIAFVKHGRQSAEAEAEAATVAMRAQPTLLSEKEGGGAAVAREERGAAAEPASDLRRVQGIKMPSVKPTLIPMQDTPEMRKVKPTDLIVEEQYQRQLSGKSIRLIKKIVGGWDWAKFKPPVCAESADGLFVIDGQHTAIAAASHPHIVTIPVMVVKRDLIERRAAAFVSQNTQRVVMTPLQIFHAEVVAGDKAATGILKTAIRAGATIPRSPPTKDKAKPGEVVSMSALRKLWAHGKPEHMERVLRIAVMSGKPLNSLLLRGIHLALLETEPHHEDLCPISELTDEEIAWHTARLNIEKQADEVAADAECSRYDALATLITGTLWDNGEEYQKFLDERAASCPR